MKIIDEKGFLFGKINIIDFLVALFLFCMLPMFYFGYKIFSKTLKPVAEPTTYELSFSCPICGFPRSFAIDRGKLPEKEYKDKCEHCGNEVFYFKEKEISLATIDYVQEYYRLKLRQEFRKEYEEDKESKE